MAKLFSVASWNVEHFKGDGPDSARVDRVVAFLAEQKPDIFGMFEVEGKTVFETLVQRMPNYTFQITEGQQTQEILIGVKRTMTSLITQRTEYIDGVDGSSSRSAVAWPSSPAARSSAKKSA